MRLSILMILLLMGQLHAEEVKVAISPFEPFVIPGTPHKGYSIDLMREVGKVSGIKYELVLTSGIIDKLSALRHGEVDMAIGGVSVTGKREKDFDFSHPEYGGGLGILTRRKKVDSIKQTASMIWQIVKKPEITGFFILIGISAILMWFVERGKNSFNDNPLIGIPEGLYFSIVTGSTVGYGDHTPVKAIGKFVTCVLIVVSLPMFGVFNAEIIRLRNLETGQASEIQSWGDLVNKDVGVIGGTTSDEWVLKILQQEPMRYEKFDDVVNALRSKHIIAFVYDAPDSPLEEQINRAMSKLKEQGTMKQLQNKWFGK
jgi:polar amino acid transport system substrate-binding protein